MIAVTDAAKGALGARLPAEFDPKVYRRRNPDLLHLADSELEGHYRRCGVHEGRNCSRVSDRKSFFDLLDFQASVLEIGPLAHPAVRGPNVKYFDVVGTSALKAKARAHGLDPDGCPNIDYMSDTGDLSVITDKFDVVVSSHAIEHQPDLIRHLRGVAELLKPSGRYYLVIPDKRYCFDHFIAESNIADILDAYLRNLRLHDAKSVVRHFSMITHNDASRHWRGDHGSPAWKSDPHVIRNALLHITSTTGTYIDAHAWQFTPESFRDIVRALSANALSPFHALRVYATVRGELEFYAILEKTNDIPALPIDVATDFDEELYLLANPDVAAAGVNAAQHYRDYGRHEGRKLRP